MASLALASLTETYTDSEGEESAHRDSIEKTDEVTFNQLEIVNQPTSKVNKPARLVSYQGHDDTIASDDEHHEIAITEPLVTEDVPMETERIVQFTDVDMPPEPTGPCAPELTDKIVEMTRRMNEKGYDMNRIIQQRKSFRNPSIYEKLIDYCNINEFGTNYGPQIYDPLKWDRSSYYDELAKRQKADMEQREKERRERTKIEFLTGTAKKTSNGTASIEDDSKKRKSKWDQVVYPGSAAPRVQLSVPSLTTTATGTKGIVISAFGSLPKKPKS